MHSVKMQIVFSVAAFNAQHKDIMWGADWKMRSLK
jgi:hypothetical protein